MLPEGYPGTKEYSDMVKAEKRKKRVAEYMEKTGHEKKDASTWETYTVKKKTEEEPEDKTAENAAETPAENAAEAPAENAAETPAENAAEAPAENACEAETAEPEEKNDSN